MKRTILIADDDDGYRYPLVNLFADSGYEVLEAINKDEVIMRAKEAEIWVIDVRLPTVQMEGIEAVVELASAGQTPSCPVIFISVLPEWIASDKLSILEKKSIKYVYLEKPFELELLLNKVRLFFTEEER